ncbi:AAA family ATPase [Ferrimicrobium sp.]|uniref:AAA family ATPase n=1 Tax=Ferrimicrobium sp. TaxID=2926050 RepID=UPI002626229A|nr:AAA family ATPase [Ferrimicrobium sp.]
MARIKGLLKNLDWQLRWLGELAPSEFCQAVAPLLGAKRQRWNVADAVLFVLLDYLDHDEVESFTKGVRQIVESMQGACEQSIVNQILGSLDDELRADDEEPFPTRETRLGDDNSYRQRSSARHARHRFFREWAPGITEFPDGTPMSAGDLARARYVYDYGYLEDKSDDFDDEDFYRSCDSDGHLEWEGCGEDFDWERLEAMATLEPRVIPDETERQALIARLAPFGGPDRRYQLELFGPKELCAISDSGANYRDQHATQRYAKMVEYLGSTGPYRDFGFRSSQVHRLIDLAAELPNFEGVIAHLAEAINLSVSWGTPLRLTPILLVGEPGIGKSYLVGRLGEILGVQHHQLEADNLHHSSALAGAEPIWSAAAPGLVFEALTSGRHVSPIISLDEIDKASYESGHGDPLAPLHSLLEPETARHFRDSYLPLGIDASHVIWIATANSLDRLSRSLLSRFLVFSIKAPTPDQSRFITDSIVGDLLAHYPGVSCDEGVIDQLTSFTPREQRRLFEAMIARVTFYEADRIVIDDFNDVCERLSLRHSVRGGLGFGG